MKYLLGFLILLFLLFPQVTKASNDVTLWEVQSVDTMKYSRDMARSMAGDKEFEKVIENEVKRIADLGATHVAIATPYDSEFAPYLKKWVDAARRHSLNVWFRGNFAGWEGWFEYPRISKEEHLDKLSKFIIDSRDLFKDGDIFTTCTECENGSLGDPRKTGQLNEYRQFLISEYSASKKAFSKINKKVRSNFFSMNGDVANLVMDKNTSKALDSVVVIDHYVKDPKQIAKDVQSLAQKSGARIMLGEFGSPIPDIHGTQSQEAQSAWVDAALRELENIDLIGINYWVISGGSTALWDSSGERKAAQLLKSYFRPQKLYGVIKNEIGTPIRNTDINLNNHKITKTSSLGEFVLPYVNTPLSLTISANGYHDANFDSFAPSDDVLTVTMIKTNENLFFKLLKFLISLLRR